MENTSDREKKDMKKDFVTKIMQARRKRSNLFKTLKKYLTTILYQSKAQFKNWKKYLIYWSVSSNDQVSFVKIHHPQSKANIVGEKEVLERNQNQVDSESY